MPLFERGRFFDLPRHVARMLLDLRDMSSAFFWFLSCQTWLSLWSFLTTLISGARAPACPPAPSSPDRSRCPPAPVTLTPSNPPLPPTPSAHAVSFFTYYRQETRPLAAPLDWVLICSVAVLPAVGFLWIAYLRRERALEELATGVWGAGGRK